MKYRCIVIDPPWTPSLGATWKTRFTDKARPQKHYKTLSLDDIKNIVPPMEKQCHVFIWGLNQHLDWAFELARHWHLEVVQILTWAKPGLGVGRFQCNSEQVLVCRHGTRHGNPFGATGGTWFNWLRGKHSEKPEEFFRLVEKISPEPRLEMYARKRRDGWDSFGDELEEEKQIPLHEVTKAHSSHD